MAEGDAFTAPKGDRSADPTQTRYLSSYVARRAYKEPVQTPPAVHGVAGAVDIHCHAGEGQQDALAIAQLASASGMKGVLYKNLPGRNGGLSPTETVRRLRQQLAEWSETSRVEPIQVWAGHVTARGSRPPSPEQTRQQIEDGAIAVWMPVAMHANTLNKVGGRPIVWDKTKSPKDHTPPLPWDEALRVGHYNLDEKGDLKPEVKEIFRIVADTGVALSFAHSTHREIFAMAEEVQKLGIRRAFVDHPFSPFVDLDLGQMRQLAAARIYLNFTYDEISPLLGVDPRRMADTIKALGTDYVTLSSDAGEPLFPNSVECMRLIRGHMRAFGLSEEQIRQTSEINPAKIVGLTPAA